MNRDIVDRAKIAETPQPSQRHAPAWQLSLTKKISRLARLIYKHLS